MTEARARCWRWVGLLVGAGLGAAAAAEPACFPVTDFGARGDGVTLNTAAIQRAIDRCQAAGGGRVLVAGGTFVTGTLFLKSHVNLHVAGGAALWGSTDIADYPAEGVHKTLYKNERHMDRCLIFARDAEGIALTGRGVIDGRGGSVPGQVFGSRQRPMILRLLRCRGIRMRDLTLRRPASWTSAWLYCEDIVVDGVTIADRANHNGDGLDFDGCRNVRVSNCAFDTSDDSICLQTSRPDRPCQDVVITNCVFSSRWAGIRIGLLSRGNLERVTVSNCVFRDIDDSGLKIQMCEGAVLRDMVFSGLVMTNVPRPFFVTLCRQRACVDAPPEPAPTGRLEGLVFRDIWVDNTAGDVNAVAVVSGLPGHPVRDLRIEGLHLRLPGGGTAAQAKRRALPEFTLETLAGHWPEYGLFHGAVPAHGLYLRHVREVTVDGCSVVTRSADVRPALVCQDGGGLVLRDLSVAGPGRGEPAFRLQSVREARIDGCWIRAERDLWQGEGLPAGAVLVGSGNRTAAAR